MSNSCSLQVYKQKVKHLLYEHQNNISTLKADGELGLKLAGEEAAKREAELQNDCRNLKLELKEQVGIYAFSSNYAAQSSGTSGHSGPFQQLPKSEAGTPETSGQLCWFESLQKAKAGEKKSVCNS